MAQDDNIVKLPDALERRALKIEAAIARSTKGKIEWIEGTIELAIEMAGARDEFPANQAFGEWFDSRLGNVAITPHDRAALIQWGREPDRTRKVLEKTERISYRTIHDNEWVVRNTYREIPRPVTPPPPEPKALPMPPPQLTSPAATPTPQPTQAKPQSQAAATRKYMEKLNREQDIRQGKSVPPLPLEKEAQDNINQQVRERAANISGLTGKARRAFEKTISTEMTKLVIELRSYKEKTDIEAQEKIRVGAQELLTRQLPDYEKTLTEARRREVYYRDLTKAVKIPLTLQEYSDVVMCCHPDNSASNEKRHTTLQMLNAKRFNLTGKK
jgi:hypothetical protein